MLYKQEKKKTKNNKDIHKRGKENKETSNRWYISKRKKRKKNNTKH